MTTQRKLLLLIGLCFIWAIVIFAQVTEQPEDIAGSLRTPSSLVSEGHTASHAENELALAETFDNPRQIVKFSPPRNIFAPLTFPKPKPQSVVKKAPPISRKSAPSPSATAPSPPKPPAPPPGPSPAELAAQRARQQLNQYRFLGYLTKGGESQAFLSNGQAIYIVKQGEQVEGRIRVRRIDPTTIVLSMRVLETGADVEAMIPLTKEQQPGMMSTLSPKESP